MILIASLVFGSFFIFTTSVIMILSLIMGIGLNTSILRIIGVALLLLWSLAIIILLVGLLLFHVFLIIRCQTTSSYLRKENRENVNTGLIMSTICRRDTELLPMWEYIS